MPAHGNNNIERVFLAALSMKFIPLVVIDKKKSSSNFSSFLSSLASALTWLICEHREGRAEKFIVVMRCNFIISLHIFIMKTHLCDLHSFDVDEIKISTVIFIDILDVIVVTVESRGAKEEF
jgi:hypothetical protein